MKRDITWLKNEVEKQEIVMDKGYIYTSDLIYLIDSLDEPEVLSQDWIDEHKVSRISNLRKMTMSDVVPVDDLENLLVPRQEELESKIKVLIEAYKQEDGAYSNPENGWISGFVEDLENLVEEEPLYYALIKGHEFVEDEGDLTCKYWKFDTWDGRVFPSNLFSQYGRFWTEMSKSEWNKIGINSSNADFVKADE